MISRRRPSPVLANMAWGSTIIPTPTTFRRHSNTMCMLCMQELGPRGGAVYDPVLHPSRLPRHRQRRAPSEDTSVVVSESETESESSESETESDGIQEEEDTCGKQRTRTRAGQDPAVDRTRVETKLRSPELYGLREVRADVVTVVQRKRNLLKDTPHRFTGIAGTPREGFT